MVKFNNRHKEWRKFAKKCRRKRIRSLKAKKRDADLQIEQERLESSPRYQSWLAEQNALEVFEREEEERQRAIRHEKWLQEEIVAQKLWKEKQERLAAAKEEERIQIMLLKEKLDEEEKKLNEEKEKLIREKEQAHLAEEKLKEEMSDFICGLRKNLPEEIRVCKESHPGKPVCPFFSKVAACRFLNTCSRNHILPGVSKVLLFPGFYSHFSFYHHQEYDTDISLEFEKADTYRHFREFYQDIVSELKNCGRLRQVKVCKNAEPHLRGNVYVEYETERAALRAYTVFQGRYYAGKQLNVHFVSVPSWRQAICGQQWNNQCGKGSSCNFLHVFNNPNSEFRNADFDRCSVSPVNRSQRGSDRSIHREAIRNNKDDINSSRRKRSSRSRHRKRERNKSHSKERKENSPPTWDTSSEEDISSKKDKEKSKKRIRRRRKRSKSTTP